VAAYIFGSAAGENSEKAMGCRVDVVVLNRAGEVIKYEVRRSGRLVFERSNEARKKFEIYSRKTYEDFLYLHKRYGRRSQV